MKIRLLFLLYVGLLLAIMPTKVLASTGAIKEAEFVIEKEKKNVLPETNRLFKKASIPTQVPKANQKLVYHWVDIQPLLRLLDHKIKLLKAKPDLVTGFYAHHIQLGYGNLYSPYLNYHFNHTNAGKYGYGLQLAHLSSGKDHYLEAYHQGARLHGRWNTANVHLDGSLAYAGNKYPFIRSSEPSRYDLNKARAYQQISLQSSLKNYATDGLHYHVPLNLSYLYNLKQEQEKQGKLTAYMKYPLKENLVLKTELGTQISQYQYSNQPVQNRHLEKIKPSLSFLINDFTIQVGLNAVLQNDQSALLKTLNLYPLLKISYQSFPWLRPYIGLSGDFQANTWHSLTTDNPWLKANPRLLNTNQQVVLYGGIKSDWHAQIALHTGVQFGSYANMPFWMNILTDNRRFKVHYEPDTKLWHLFNALTYTSFTGNLATRLEGHYYHYRLKELAKPWHKPRYELSLHPSYKIYDKIALKGRVFWMSGIEAFNPRTQTAEALQDIIDLDLGVDYLWNARFTIFLNCQNVLFRNQVKYLNTPAQAFKFLLGISYVW